MPPSKDESLFEATVPVFRHYLERAEHLLTRLSAKEAAYLDRRLAPHAFTAGEHLDTAAGFAIRTVWPLVGRKPDDVDHDEGVALDRDGLIARVRKTQVRLDSVTPLAFEGAADRTVTHVAGHATLRQDGWTFATAFALPNFFFHFVTAFSILRHAGMQIGKADFDGQHDYPANFHF